ncbi:hypothetical protein BaRGS_00022532 [Batillaria attramentaria]|uniref:Uncharacterized protein n=1 Tax=Batillaria attramentaria TaxID=370345 RepID=A0ABD0KGK8_9CAEN
MMELGKSPRFSQREEPDTTGPEHEEDVLISDPGDGNYEEHGPSPGTFRRKRRVKGEKVCAVCGDHAMSHNFGALTCETCKAFFRRNANRQKDIPSCVFQDKCEINKATRRFCAACRLKKCFAVGMNADLILDDKERTARKRKGRVKTVTKGSSDIPDVMNTRGQHGGHEQASAHHTAIAQHTTLPPSSNDRLSPISAAINRFYDFTCVSAPHGPVSFSPENVSTSTQSAGTLQAAHTSDSAQWSPQNQGIQSLPFKAYMTSSIPREQRKLRGRDFQHVAREELPWDMKLYWPLTNDERQLLTQLSSAYQDMMMAMVSPEHAERPRIRAGQAITVEDLLFTLEQSLRKCVHFSKAIPEFHRLRKADQISTLKASAMQLSSIRATAFFLPERNLWRNNLLGDVSVQDVLDHCSHHPCVSEFAQFCKSLKSVAKTNCTVYALMHTLALFDARDDKLEERVLVNTLKDRYLILLKHHLESEFSFLHADRYLNELMEILVDVRQLGQTMMEFYRQYSHMFKPLLTEIFSKFYTCAIIQVTPEIAGSGGQTETEISRSVHSATLRPEKSALLQLSPAVVCTS